MTAPDPRPEIAILSLVTIPGANFWSTFPVTRLDLAVGAFDDISSADVPGLTDALVAALPGLAEHRCSIGERGGFITRLRRGTYAPHIVEHLALELQSMVGHDVGYGRARGGDRPGEYTVVVEHVHPRVGEGALREATELVRQAFAGEPLAVEDVVEGLLELADQPVESRPTDRILCGITGAGALDEVAGELVRAGLPERGVVSLSPVEILEAGLPYACSEVAIILDAEPGDVPPRYREPEAAARLLAVVGDGVRRGGLVVVPAKEWEVQELVRDAGRRVGVFAGDEGVSRRDARVAVAVARPEGEEIVVEREGEVVSRSARRPEVAAEVQAAALLALWGLEMGREVG